MSGFDNNGLDEEFFLKIKIGKVIFFVILDMVMKNKPGPEHLGMNLMKL